MCGRYTQMHSWQELHDLMSLTVPAIELKKRYNISPTQMAPVVRLQEDGGKHLDMLRWGLIPGWAKDTKISYNLINARAETVASKPSFRSAFKRRRCLIPSSGFYEWKKTEHENSKQPYLIKSPSMPIIFAGIWESWTSPANEIIESYCIITTQANTVMKQLHERMPVIIQANDFDRWLDNKTALPELVQLMQPSESVQLELIAVSKLVNNARKDDPACILPIK